MDFDRAVSEFEGDREGVLEITRGFIQNVGIQVKSMREAIAAGNGEPRRNLNGWRITSVRSGGKTRVLKEDPSCWGICEEAKRRMDETLAIFQ